jgi:O-antigen biosynthesis alpha-1,3-mannosyltransferase
LKNNALPRDLRIAIVHEWFTTIAGSEKVIEQLLKVFPSADIFAVIADPEVVQNSGFLAGKKLTTSFIQKLPGAQKHFRNYLLLMPLAVEQFDLSSYDVVISSAHAVSKGVLTGPDQLHLSYVHSPIRYAWDLQHQYLRESGLTSGAKSWLVRWMLHKIRIWDYRTSAGVDQFVANSRFIARRIRKVYRREAEVIYPPVDVTSFELCEDKGEYYLAASRLVPYKRMDLIVRAFAKMPHRKLVVIGDGPDMQKLRGIATSNIELCGYQPFEQLKSKMQQAKAFVFAAEEDFGITPVEAQACGTPVIAFGKGGALETVVDADNELQATGVFFEEQTESSLISAVERFESLPFKMQPVVCRRNAERFSEERFRKNFEQLVTNRWCKLESEIKQPTLDN